MRGNGRSEVKYFPDSRISTIDVYAIGMTKHHVKALMEVDITTAMDILKQFKAREGHSLSTTAWLVKCISVAVSEHREAAAFLRNNRSVLIFQDIDIAITVEKECNGSKVPLPYVIRNTNAKSVLDIHHEVRQAMSEPVEDGKVVIGQKQSPLYTRLFLSLPAILRRLIWRRILLKPHTAHANMGSVMLTSVGMFSSFDGWAIPSSIHPLCFAIGSLTKKPGVINDEIAIRDYLKLTVLIDHDVMDGAPAARFLSRLNDLLQSAYGLERIYE